VLPCHALHLISAEELVQRPAKRHRGARWRIVPMVAAGATHILLSPPLLAFGEFAPGGECGVLKIRFWLPFVGVVTPFP
jgi:hypothetical protein